MTKQKRARVCACVRVVRGVGVGVNSTELEQSPYLPCTSYPVETHYQKFMKQPVTKVMKVHNSLGSTAKLMKLVQRIDNHNHHHTSVMQCKCHSSPNERKSEQTNKQTNKQTNNLIQLASPNPRNYDYCSTTLTQAPGLPGYDHYSKEQ